MPELHHASDPLQNLSRFAARCHVCGRDLRDSVTVDVPAIWLGCSCGHLVRVENCERWH